MFCWQCGQKNPEIHTFCTYCGARIHIISEQQTTAIIIDTDNIDDLIRFLEHKDKAVRFEAVEKLRRLQATEAVPFLIKRLKNPKENAFLRWNIIMVLGELGDSSVIDDLEFFLAHKTAYVRELALRSLKQLKMKKNYYKYELSLKDSDYLVRKEAITALWELDHVQARPILSAYKWQAGDEEKILLNKLLKE